MASLSESCEAERSMTLINDDLMRIPQQHIPQQREHRRAQDASRICAGSSE